MAWLKGPTEAIVKVSLPRAIVTIYGLEHGWSIYDQHEALMKLNGLFLLSYCA